MGIYLAYLLDVDRNKATFALHTLFAGPNNSGDASEFRIASMLDDKKIPSVLESMDLAAGIIRDWKGFYRWLGGGRQWGAFTSDSGMELVPHWVAPSTEYDCVRILDQPIAFFDRNCATDPRIIDDVKICGISPEDRAILYVQSIQSNLMVTTQPLFP